MKIEDSQIIGNYLQQYFSSIENEGLMNGFWTYLPPGYNITLFYLDTGFGVTTYKFQATLEDLKGMGITQLNSQAESVPAPSPA